MPTYTHPIFYTLWAQRFHQALEGFGHTYARQLSVAVRDGGAHRVYKLEVLPGQIHAQAADRYGVTHQVQINARPMSEAVCERVGKALTADPSKLSAILAHIPRADIEQAFVDAGGWLFPHDPSDLRASCTCARTWEGFCSHVAAVLLSFCARLESAPSLLPELWECPVERLAKQVQAEWTAFARQDGAAAPEEAHRGLPDAVRPAAFFASPRPLPEREPPIGAPATEGALLRRLGRPPFAEGEEDVGAALAPLYAYVTKRAVQAWDRTAPGAEERRLRRRGRAAPGRGGR